MNVVWACCTYAMDDRAAFPKVIEAATRFQAPRVESAALKALADGASAPARAAVQSVAEKAMAPHLATMRKIGERLTEQAFGLQLATVKALEDKLVIRHAPHRPVRRLVEVLPTEGALAPTRREEDNVEPEAYHKDILAAIKSLHTEVRALRRDGAMVGSASARRGRVGIALAALAALGTFGQLMTTTDAKDVGPWVVRTPSPTVLQLP